MLGARGGVKGAQEFRFPVGAQEDIRIAVFFGIDVFKIHIRAKGGVRLAECEHFAGEVQKGIFVRLFAFHGRCVRAHVYGQIQKRAVRFGETEVFARFPLHRRARAGAVAAAFFGRQVYVAHTDFVAVIHGGDAGQKHRKRNVEFALGVASAAGHTHNVVVARRRAHKASGAF